MVDVGNSGMRHLAVRLSGLGLLACCYLSLRLLAQDADRAASVLDYVAAAVGFLSLSAGGALTVLGAHIFDRVDVSERWARTSCAPPTLDRGERAIHRVRAVSGPVATDAPSRAAD